MADTPFPDSHEIFLSDSTLDTRPNLTVFPNLAANPLFSIGRCYNRKTGQMKKFAPRTVKNPFRAISRAIKVARCAAGDSGGFQILMGKLPSNLDPRVTVAIYKKAGFRATDKPIQLDLPPPYNISSKKRLELIRRSALNYHIMAAELKNVVPVIHGWTQAELEQSHEWLCDPDRISVGSNLATGTRTKARMTAAVGACLQSGQFVNDTMNPSHSQRPSVIATGSNVAATTPFANDFMNPSYFRGGVSTPACLTEGHGTYALDHVVSSRSPSGAVAIGSNSAAGRNYVFDHIKKAGQRKARIRVPMKTILKRWALVANLLRKWDLMDDAGSLGQSLHYQHLGFLAGFTWGDSSAWRMKACLGEIALPYIKDTCIGGWRHCGLRQGKKGRKISSDERKLIQGWLNDPTNPLSIYSMTTEYFLELVKYNMPEWRATRPAMLWPLKPFETRCLWNAWIFKEKEQTWINNFANDPDRLYYALLRRFAAPGFGRLRNELRFFYQELQRPYVQTTAQVILKGDLNGAT
ncbi:MAG: hypothetical protein ACE5OZ_10285 [Candidatus Heimdallarchaeota archaeon]